MNDLMPILKSMYKRKSNVLLLILQISITLTILVNTAYILSQKYQRINQDSGLNEADTFSFVMNLQGSSDELLSLLTQDLMAIRSLESVKSAAHVSNIPYSSWGGAAPISLLDQQGAPLFRPAYYFADEHLLEAWDIQIIAGRWFNESDIFYYRKTTDNTEIQQLLVISQALAQKLYPANWRQAIGTQIYVSSEVYSIIGIAKQVPSAWSWWKNHDFGVISNANHLTFDPKISVKAMPGMREQAMQDVKEQLMQTPGRWIDRFESFESIRKRNHQSDSAIAYTLISIITIITIVVALGIYAQVRFSIVTRRKQIGTRRALGASKSQILRYFMLESFVISSIGIVVGIIFAIVINAYLVDTMSLSAVPFNYLLIGAVSMWILGLLATLQPVIQATKVSPAIVTRGI
ncbi:FtsX-like permease family protein [Pseudoalteromonas sp. JBTF-M23]|uniref:FtsX-like permease family protein n=1 Tax=Pseudoalteromonas caenipelagi TaxID=2726988 RepID=A0A849VH18_9GAMM|nr:FtsX-like permease family protein [Pseudoalteromonas caenipelagi]NOU51011.1 FtsX-like permease family protein [Pseudoalteromonas caenipelagi]